MNKGRITLFIFLFAYAFCTQANTSTYTPNKKLAVSSARYANIMNQFKDKETVRVIIKPRGEFYFFPEHDRKHLNLMAVTDKIQQQGVQDVQQLRYSGLAVARLSKSQFIALASSGAIDSIYETRRYKVYDSGAVGYDPLKAIRVLTPHKAGFKGQNSTIVVVDTGVKTEIFGGSIDGGGCFSDIDEEVGNQSICANGKITHIGVGAGEACDIDSAVCSHGSTVAELALGVAPEAKILPIQIGTIATSNEICRKELGRPAPCLTIEHHSIIEAMNWIASVAEEKQVAAVNLSLGHGPFSTQSDCDAQDPGGEFSWHVQSLNAIGASVVAAAGNEQNKKGISFPACLQQVLSVGSYSIETNEVSHFSNSSSLLDIVAPGEQLITPFGRYLAEGTSWSAPIVSGSLALASSITPNFSAKEREAALIFTGDQIRDPGTGEEHLDPTTGFTQINPATNLFFPALNVSDFLSELCSDERTAAVDACAGIFAKISARKALYPGVSTSYQISVEVDSRSNVGFFEVWRETMCGDMELIYTSPNGVLKKSFFTKTQRGDSRKFTLQASSVISRAHKVRRCVGAECGPFQTF